MKRFGQLLRLIYINRVLVRHGLDEVVLGAHLFRPIRFLQYLVPWNWIRRFDSPPEVRLRKALEDLGPIFIKFGQLLSTRRDLLPDVYAVELAKLQDQVPPFSGQKAIAIIEKAYQKKIVDIFAEFDANPLASASIAQVHVAKLRDGSDVVVKVLRPDISRVIKRDIGLLYIIADMAERYWSEARRLHPREVVEEYNKTILDELDLMREAASASQLRRHFSVSDQLYIPDIHWPYTRRNVMVMERISGIPISDIESLKQHQINLKKLAEDGVEIFFTQVFKNNFFHADMHPGNIFVSPEGKYIAVDFGIVGTLNKEDQRYLAENLLAFFKRDYHRVAQLHVESGWVPIDTRVDEFESAIRTVCEPIFERPLKDISFGHLLVKLFQTARRFNMEVQPQLVLLQKTLLNIEGLGRQLYPDLDLWQTAKPFLERWMHEQLGLRSFANSVAKGIPEWIEKMPEIPGLIYDVLKQQSELGRRDTMAKEYRRLNQEMRRSNRVLFRGLIASALIISVAILLGFDGGVSKLLGQTPIMFWVLAGFGAGFVLLLWPSDKD